MNIKYFFLILVITIINFFMKNHILFSLLALGSLLTIPADAQRKKNKLPEQNFAQAEPESHIRFLASDEMQGRRTGEQGNHVAARYLAEQFRHLGLKPASGNDYLQLVPFEQVRSSKEGTILAGSDTLQISKQFIVVSAEGAALANAPVVFVGYGWADDKGYNDYKDIDVKGKVVIASLGTPDAKTPGENLRASERKNQLAAEKGAVALIEIFTLSMPWQTVTRYFGGDRLGLASESKAAGIPHVWVSGQAKKSLPNGLNSISMRFAGQGRSPVRSYNVAAVLEGSDPVLKNEYLILSAHYDHVGTGKNGGASFSPSDSIFNGTRDNAFGTVAVLMAAKALSEQKPKRSILFLGFTAEEIGLLGSRYYSEHPLVPLKQCVYNLNCDGAGYSDTTLVTMIGLNRTDVKPEIEQGCQAFGLTVNDDPAPEQNLFDRSDNVNFAAKGIPSPTYSLGFRKFDAEIMKFYHQVTDNPETISFGYLLKYCQAYTYTARLIADRAAAPKWVVGDKYEKAFMELYNTGK